MTGRRRGGQRDAVAGVEDGADGVFVVCRFAGVFVKTGAREDEALEITPQALSFSVLTMRWMRGVPVTLFETSFQELSGLSEKLAKMPRNWKSESSSTGLECGTTK